LKKRTIIIIVLAIVALFLVVHFDLLELLGGTKITEDFDGYNAGATSGQNGVTKFESYSNFPALDVHSSNINFWKANLKHMPFYYF